MRKYRIGISYDEEEKAKKLKEEEVKRHAAILYSLYEDTDDDGFQNALKKEIEAIRKALSSTVNERKNVYLDNHKKGGENGEKYPPPVFQFRKNFPPLFPRKEPGALFRSRKKRLRQGRLLRSRKPGRRKI